MNKITTVLIILSSFYPQENCEGFKYKILFKDPMLMCPHLGPKIYEELNNLSECEIIENSKRELIFHSDIVFTHQVLDSLLIKKIGLPRWEVDTLIHIN